MTSLSSGRRWPLWMSQALSLLADPGAYGRCLSYGAAGRLLVVLQDLARLGARCFVGLAFFRSGLTKIRDWDITLTLFQDDYHVPLLPPELAAWMGTGGELLLPVLLVTGFGGRFAALGLSVVNVMAVMSLPEIAPAALLQHQLWGTMLLALAFFGPGRGSVDQWAWRRRGRTAAFNLIPVGGR